MKKLFSLALIAITVSSFAQSDSLTNTLHRYKAMYEQGLIDSSEYKAMRNKALGIEAPVQQQLPQTIIIRKEEKPLPKLSMNEMRDLRAGGNTALAFGVLCLLSSDVCWIYEGIQVPKQTKFTAGTIIAPIFGVVLTAIGIPLVVIGGKDKHRYNKYMNATSFGLNKTGTGLAYNF